MVRISRAERWVLSGPFGARADRIVNRHRETTVCFEDSWVNGPGTGEGYYLLETASPGTPLPLNQQNALDRTCVALWLATGNPWLGTVRNPSPGTSETVSGTTKPHAMQDGSGKGSEDISHASINTDFAFQCYRAGIVFDRRDMERFAGTVIRVYAAGDSLASRVDGSGGYDQKFARQAGRWLQLAYIEPKVAEVLYRHISREDIKTVLGNATGMITAAYFTEVWTLPFRKEQPVKRC